MRLGAGFGAAAVYRLAIVLQVAIPLPWLLTDSVVGSVLRFIAASIMAVVLVEVFRTAGLGRRGLLLRVIGLRPSGGVIHRPLD